MSKKMIATIAAMALVASVAAGCSGSNNNSNSPSESPASAKSASPQPSTSAASQYGDTGGLKLPIVDKPTTLTWMLVSDQSNLPNSMVVKEIEKRTGIKLEIQAYASQTYKDKLKVVVASGKLPDIFHGLTPAEVNQLGLNGAVTPINNHLNDLPNFKKLYVDNAENNWVMKSWSDEKNNLYSWPIYGLQRDVNHGFLFRKDIFDKHNMKEWTTTGEFYEALKALKQAYPDSYPYASKTKEFIFRDWGFGWGIAGAQYPAYYDEKAKEWKFMFTQPEYKEMLTFMKKLYDEKLLDPEFITDTEASWTAKMTTGKSFVTFDWIGRLDQFATQMKSHNPEYNLRYANPVGPTGNVRSLPKIDNWGTVVANNDKKEIALKLLDYLTSPSGSSLVTMGIEGETYKLENGKPVYPELKDMPKVDIKTLESKYGLWLEGMYLRPDRRSVYYNYTEKEQEAQDKINKDKKFEAADPILKFNEQETKTIAELQASLMKAANEFSTKFIMNKSYGDA